VRILQGYLIAKYGNAGSLILVGRKETLTNDKVDDPTAFAQIKHFDSSNPEYYTLPPRVRAAANAINNLGISGPLKKGGPSIPHVAGFATLETQIALRAAGYGVIKTFGPKLNDNVPMFENALECTYCIALCIDSCLGGFGNLPFECLWGPDLSAGMDFTGKNCCTKNYTGC
jgi:hypothetical protein